MAQSECFLIDDDFDEIATHSTTSPKVNLINKNECCKSASNFEKFRLLMWKNWLLQKRNKIQTIAELLIPIILVVILVVIRSRVQPIHFKNATKYKPFELNPRNGFNQTNKNDKLRLVFSPENHLLEKLLKQASMAIGMKDPIGVSNSSAIELEVVKGHCIAGVQFKHSANITELPINLTYSLRFPSIWRVNSSTEKWQTNQLFPKKMDGARTKNSKHGGPPSYWHRGFLLIQDAIARAYIKSKCKSRCELPQIFMQRYPYPPYIKDDVIPKMKTIFPFFILLCFCYPAINTVRFIALEKERNLKEAMKIMGLPNWLHWSSWFVRTILLMTVMITMIVLLLKMQVIDSSIAVITHSDWTMLWILFFVYSISMITYCFMLSVFFSSANSASAVAGLFWFILYLPYFVSVESYDDMTHTSKIITCLPPNSAMAYAIHLIIKFESYGVGLQWSNLWRTVNNDDNLTVGTTICLMLISSTFYMLIALYAEKVVPGSFGISEKWYFPFTVKFWFGPSEKSRSKEAKSEAGTSAQRLPHGPNFESESNRQRTGIKIINLRKEFPNGKVACRDLTLNMYMDQITVLLGHNGAGKTTTITTLIGMIEPTSGTAIINGYDIRKNPQKAISSIGFCPQYDILFDELTVREHIIFYSQLKGMSGAEVENEVNKYITLLELEPKADARSDTLSGGMKRKLSVGVALCGGSKVVLCDEPSSGMDPAARRSLWNLLNREKQNRTILLTTHFMDEADALADRIAIMVEGELKCCGSSFFLKKRFGTGYHLVCVKNENCLPAAVTHVLQKYIPDIKIQTEIGHELTYELPENDVSTFEKMFNELERFHIDLGLDSFGLSLTTMEDVFLKVGSDSEKFDKLANANDSIIETSDYYFDDNNVVVEREFSLSNGFRLSFNQWYAMLKKKYICWKRCWILFFIQNSITVSCILATVWIYHMVKINEDLPPLKISFDSYKKTVTLLQVPNATQLIRSIFNTYISQTPTETLPIEEDIENYFLNLASKKIVAVNSKYMAGLSFNSTANYFIAWFNNQAFHTPPLSLNAIHNAMVKETFDSNHSIQVINWPLPYNEDSLDKLLTTKNDVGHKIAMNLSICMAFVAAFYVIPQIKERMSKAKLLQYVSGLGSSIYWFSTFLFDLCTFVITILITLATILIFKEEGWSNLEQLEPAFVLFICFGFSAMPLTYILSRFFSTHSVGFIRLIVIYLLTGIAVHMIVLFLKELKDINSNDVANAMKWIFMIFPNYALSDGLMFVNTNNTGRQICREICEKKTINIKPNKLCNNIGHDGQNDHLCKLIAPNFPPNFESFCYQSLGNMSNLDSQSHCEYITEKYTDCSLDMQCHMFGNFCCFNSFYDWNDGILRNIVYTIVSGIVYFILLMMMENRPITQFYYYLRKLKNPPSAEPRFAEDDDVKRENEMVRSMDESDLNMNNLVLKELTKFYGDFFAVKGISARVRHSEVFGLLGINGAGKTTTFKMLTGDVKISKGDAYVRGISLRDDVSTVQRLIGYCPQFDALIEDMTGRETLEMFAKLRGVRSKDIKPLSIRLAMELNFMKHIDKKVMEYSGGNKRKLSTAVALIGSPFVVYLDEPTTGMDPGAKRHLWNVISKLRKSGKTIVLTSHSMEECEALCTRLAIMVNGEFKCLGSIQHLKNKFSNGYLLMVKARRHFEVGIDNGFCQSTEELTRIKDFIANNFSGAVLKEEYQGLLTYHIPTCGSLKWSQMFGLMERGKQDYQIEDYSIGQTSLEQVFLSFTKYQLEDLK